MENKKKKKKKCEGKIIKLKRKLTFSYTTSWKMAHFLLQTLIKRKLILPNIILFKKRKQNLTRTLQKKKNYE